MIEITEEIISEINAKAPYDFDENEQGIFKQPYGVPTDIKEHVIYMRNKTGGYRGGSCYDTIARYWETEVKYKFVILDIVLEILHQNITYTQYEEIKSLIHTNNETDREYYGNSTDYEIQYIVLSELLTLLNNF